MTIAARGTVDVTAWEESAFVEAEGMARQARAVSQTAFTGGLEGTGRSDWLLVYPASGVGAAHFVGLQTFEGSADGRPGSFVLEVRGTFDEAGPHVQWSVLPGSGTGELVGAAGDGGYEGADYTLDLTLDA
jgi:hypothetical protein